MNFAPSATILLDLIVKEQKSVPNTGSSAHANFETDTNEILETKYKRLNSTL